jgi:hypothetical protein
MSLSEGLARDRHHPAALALAVARPSAREAAALLHHVAARIGALGRGADLMPERQFGKLARKVRRLGAPGSKRTSETMRRDVGAAHLPQDGFQNIEREWPAAPLAWKDKVALTFPDPAMPRGPRSPGRIAGCGARVAPSCAAPAVSKVFR